MPFPKIRIKDSVKPLKNHHISNLMAKQNSTLSRSQGRDDDLLNWQFQALDEQISWIQSEEKME